MISFLTDITVDGVALWVVLLICVGVFLGAFMDAIAGGGGIITVPTYLMGLSNLPIYNALGTNKLSSGIGTIFSTARFIHQGLEALCPGGNLIPDRLCLRHLAPAPHPCGSAEIPAAGGAAGGSVHHPADPEVAG